MGRLATKDLKDVLEAVAHVCAKWKLIGLQLGMPPEKLDEIECKHKDPRNCFLEVLNEWLKGLDPEPTWEGLAKALRSRSVGEVELAGQIETSHYQTDEVHAGPYEDSHLFVRARDSLSPLTSLASSARMEVAQEFLTKFVTDSVNSGIQLEIVTSHLQKLYTDFRACISDEVYKRSQELAVKLQAESLQVKGSPLALVAREPLFCKDTVYHAGLCSRLVSDPAYDTGNYLKFFKDRKLVPGHSFKAVSISRSKSDRYVIARKDESTFYFAFQSELQLSEWGKDFNCFYEGIKKQCKKFPVRFIVELLNKQHRIVLTGFSFGGLLACAIAASVWNTPYLSTDLLIENLVCVTFGQPFVAEQLVLTRPGIVSTLHAIYTQDDVVPSLMKLLDDSWSAKALLEESAGQMGSQPMVLSLDQPHFKDATTASLLDKFGKLQDKFGKLQTSPLGDISELETKLNEVIPKCSKLQLTTTVHMIASQGASDLVMTTLKEEEVQRYCSIDLSQTKKICSSAFEKHSMAEYSDKAFWGYLETSPKYSLPPAQKLAPHEVDDLKPSISKVQMTHHGSETAITLEGTNLWFCHQVSVRGHTLATPPDEISGTSIQFHVPKTSSDRRDVNESSRKVVVYTHFSKPLKQEPQFEEQEYSVSTRQEQLARLSPPKLIELAYLSALLEQHPHSNCEPSSHKLEVIRSFLEKVVCVVPIESIGFAIAYASREVGSRLLKILLNAKRNIPSTWLMQQGLATAYDRLQLGVLPHVSRKYTENVNEQIGAASHYNSYMDFDETSNQVLIQSMPRVAGRNLPIVIYETAANVEEGFNTMPFNPEFDALHEVHQRIEMAHEKQAMMGNAIKLVSEVNIEVLYPIRSTSHDNELKSPIVTLTDGRENLLQLAKTAHRAVPAAETRQHCNQQMLKAVNEIRSNELAICTSLLGGFMYQGAIDIALVKTGRDKSEPLHLAAQATVGVWALFSLDYAEVQPILAKCHGDQLLVKILDYVKTISGVELTTDTDDDGDNPYAAKLQFIVQGMTKTVTCNSQYVSYSLEQQLVELCKERKINASISLTDLTMKWGKLFKDTTFSLVHHICHPLLARWMKWALMIHDLREELAKYTSVGVVGLVNSGKSVLVNTLFGIQVPTGTTEEKRTTVPFMYNMELDDSDQGLDVVDFPGVDDEDDTIPDLADLLLTITQIVIFVVDYRKAHTQSAKKWLERLHKENVPVLVCLTFGDRLYAEHMGRKQEHPSREAMTQVLKHQLEATKEKLKSTGSHKVDFFSFSQDNDSVLNCPEGRESLRAVGVGTPETVGEWLVDVFRRDFGQEQLADKLETFIALFM